MKKFVLILLLFLTLTLPVLATEVDDFAGQYRQYKQVQEDYDTSKNEYLKHDTLNSRTDAETNTKAFLIQRNKMLRAYLIGLRYRLHSTFGVSKEDLDTLTDKINNEVNFIDDNTQKLEELSTPTLPQLFNISKEIEDKQDTYNLLSYHALNIVSFTKVNNLYNQFANINDKLKTHTDNSSISYIKNWHSNSFDTQQKIKDQLNNTQTLIDEWKKGKLDRRSMENFTTINTKLEEIKRELQKGISYQKEIMVKLEEEFLNK